MRRRLVSCIALGQSGRHRALGRTAGYWLGRQPTVSAIKSHPGPAAYRQADVHLCHPCSAAIDKNLTFPGHRSAETLPSKRHSHQLSASVLPLCLQISLEQIMEVAIRKMGNSQGVLIPKPILAQVGLEGTADLQVRDGVIEIRAIRRNSREGWADDARRLAAQGDDALVWPEFANEGDDKLVW